MFNYLGMPLLTPKTEPVDVDDRISSNMNGKTRTIEQKQNLASILPKPMDVQRKGQGQGQGRGSRVSMAPVGGMNPANMCKICGKWFRSRQQVAQHMLVHTDERKHKCNFCDRAFKQASHLQQHHRIHTGEKPYRCPLPGCERAFPQLSNLNHHLRNHDKPEPPASNTCVYCDRVYASETVLKTHIEKIHLNANGDLKPNVSLLDAVKTTPSSQASARVNRDKPIKIAPAPLASMTVAPPVLNFSQAFFQPFVHELNLVQLPPHLSQFSNNNQLQLGSKMTIPISTPQKSGDSDIRADSLKMAEALTNEIDRQNFTSNRSGHYLSSQDIVGATAKPRNSSFTQAGVTRFCNSTDDIQQRGATRHSTERKNGNVADSVTPVPTELFMNRAFNQNAMDNVIKAANAAKMFDQTRDYSDDSESDVEEIDFDIANKDGAVDRYLYTMDTGNLAPNDMHVASRNKQESDYINNLMNIHDQKGIAKSRAKNNTVYRDEDNQLNRNNDDLETNGGPNSINAMKSDIKHANFNGVDNDIDNNNDINHDSKGIECVDDDNDAIVNDLTDMQNAKDDNFDQQKSSRSRKRKAFRPQRVIHEKVFIVDDDV